VKLSAGRVEGFLARPDPAIGIVLLYGPDGGLVAERGRRLAAGVVGDAADPFRVAELEPERLKAEPRLLLEEAQSLSMIGGRRLVRVRRAADLVSPAMRLLLGAGEPAAFVLLEAGELAASSSLRKLVEGAAVAMALPCYPSEGQDLAASIRALLAEQGLSVEREALEHLAAHLGADRGVTRQELDKLALFVGDREDRTARLADVAAVVDDGSALAIDDLLGALLRGAHDIGPLLDRLLAAGQRPESILRVTAGLLLQLLRCVLAVEAGAASAAALAGARLPPYGRRRKIVEQALRSWRSPDIIIALTQLRQAEAASRTRRAPTELICSHALTSLGDLARARDQRRPGGGSTASVG
jgi:DNA polymerase III subunit delta